MKTILVEKDLVRTAERYVVEPDGTIKGEPWEYDLGELLPIGFSVWVFDGDELVDTKYYAVYDNEDKVLEQIKADFPPDKYGGNIYTKARATGGKEIKHE